MSSTPVRQVIVNADDLGRTSGINSGIFEAHSRGLVTSATLMVGYPAAIEAAAQIKNHPELGIGLHIALTGQASLLDPEHVPSLVDASGRFPAKPEGLIDLNPGEVRAEVRAQFDRFRELTGRPPTHLDSHHHSHRNPIVLDALVELAKEHGLPMRRASTEVGERLVQEGLATTDVFVERFFGERTFLVNLIDILADIRAGVTEIMCHPAHVDDELRDTSSYGIERARELEMLTHPNALRAARELDLQLVHFGTACGS